MIPENAGDYGKSMELWNLSTDVFDSILEHLSFEDYVHLTQTNSHLRSLLNNSHLFEIVWKAQFSDTLEAYEWPFSEEHEMQVGKEALYRDIREVRETLKEVRDTVQKLVKLLWYSENSQESQCLDMASAETKKLKDALDRVILTYSVEERYFIPLVYLSNQLWQEFCNETSRTDFSFNMSMMCWAQKLLHIQNVNIALKNLLEANGQTTTNLERFFLDISRFDFNFHDLSLIRLKTLRKMRKIVHNSLPLDRGVLGFEDEATFLNLMASIATKLLRQLPQAKDTNPVSTGINVLREYVGQPQEPFMYRLSILAKIMQEEVFSKLKFQIGAKEGKSVSFNVQVSPKLVLFGNYRLRIASDTKHIVAEVGPYSNIDLERMVASPIDYRKAVLFAKMFTLDERQAGDLNLMKYPCFSTNFTKWKDFLDQLDARIGGQANSAKEFSFSDRCLYRGCFQGEYGEYILKHWNCDILPLGMKSFEDWHFSRALIDIDKPGRLIFNLYHHVYAVMYQTKKRGIRASSCVLHPHDAAHPTTYDNGCEFLSGMTAKSIQWLMRTEGFNYMALFYLPQISLSEGEYRFSIG